ncbi:uncharacterized protein LOC116176541 [Photinus pyralis]|uniref:Uncharacterized protein n=1 Tax=Photinus pyralis TaxID=7054 RepID=A0A1Y1KDE0_PHOPY|nr:uncharacterized protein LOC116176541 [Photinus pyralis]
MRNGAIIGVFINCIAVHALIVPDELPSLLSVIYSNIPTIKKGTDSRYGWGFRLGNRADFQVLVELGPQLNTQPLRQVPGSGASKRNVPNNLGNYLYAQQQEMKRKNDSWLDNWKESMQTARNVQALPEGAKPGLAVGEIDAKSVIPDDSAMVLQKLYTLASSTEKPYS